MDSLFKDKANITPVACFDLTMSVPICLMKIDQLSKENDGVGDPICFSVSQDEIFANRLGSVNLFPHAR